MPCSSATGRFSAAVPLLITVTVRRSASAACQRPSSGSTLTRPAARRDEDQDDGPAAGAQRLERARLRRPGRRARSAGADGADRQSRRERRRAPPVRRRDRPESRRSGHSRTTSARRGERRRRPPRPRPARPRCAPIPSRRSTGPGPATRTIAASRRRARRCVPSVPRPADRRVELGRSSWQSTAFPRRSALAIPAMKPSNRTSAASAPQRAEPGGIRATAVASSTSGSSSAATGTAAARNAEVGERAARSVAGRRAWRRPRPRTPPPARA